MLLAGLRAGGRAFTFNSSHFASNQGDLVRARSVLKHRALPVRLWFVTSSFSGSLVLPLLTASFCIEFSGRWRSWAGACGPSLHPAPSTRDIYRHQPFAPVE